MEDGPAGWRSDAVLHGDVWGSLWAATVAGERALDIADMPRVIRAANDVARVLVALI